MARSGSKLYKLKSVLKKLNSFNTKLSRGGSSIAAAAAAGDDSNSNSYSSSTSSSYSVDSAGDLQPVYVGKSRRRYLLSPDIVDHPLFRELAERSDNDIRVGCEVVMFEHLLWMLENADPLPESVDELADFYAC
ncbi:unnamed protein product [Linum tenue]|uniref:Uncharacterized protein n=1 Tax=Linum tenue TaxID=586396 RepID=A0AAV0S4R5_9ROSI|nr:unnamed protein product [Linum tenue]